MFKIGLRCKPDPFLCSGVSNSIALGFQVRGPRAEITIQSWVELQSDGNVLVREFDDLSTFGDSNAFLGSECDVGHASHGVA